MATRKQFIFDGLDLPTALLIGGAVFAAWFAWMTPNHYPPWLSFHGELSMAVAGLCYGVWVLWLGRVRRDLLPVAAAVAIVTAAVPVAQLGFGLLAFAGDAWLASIYLLGFGLALWCGYMAAERFGLQKSLGLLQAVILAGALSSVWLALYQWLGLDYLDIMAIDIVPGMRPYANVIQPNQLATLLMLGLLAAAFFYESGAIGPTGALMAALLCSFGMAMTQSRSGLLQLVVVAAVMLWRHRLALTGRISALRVSIFAAATLAMPFLWGLMLRFFERTSTRDAVEMVSAGTRPIHWATLLDAALRRPWFGYGWNQIGSAQYAAAPDHTVSHETLAQSHSLILDLLIGNGLPLGLLLVAGLVTWFAVSIRRARDPLTLITLCSVIAVFMHALVEFPLHYAYFLLPTGVMMGAISYQSTPRAVVRVPRWLAGLFLVLVGGMTAAVTLEYFRLESDVRQMRFRQAQIVSQTEFKPSTVRVLTQLGHFWHFANTPERRGLSSEELLEMKSVVLRFPSKENMIHYAASLALNGHGPDAQEVLRRICFMNPESECKRMQEVWRFLGEKYPEVGQVGWPVKP